MRSSLNSIFSDQKDAPANTESKQSTTQAKKYPIAIDPENTRVQRQSDSDSDSDRLDDNLMTID